MPLGHAAERLGQRECRDGAGAPSLFSEVGGQITAKAIVERFLERQREMYAGGELGPVAELLAEDVVWHVPGTSPIAGEHRGREAVLGYFVTRRRLAGGEISIVKHGELAGDDVLVQLADGCASFGGQAFSWRTTGIYRVAGGMIAEAWLVPLEAEAFDGVWCQARTGPFVYRQRVRPWTAQRAASSVIPASSSSSRRPSSSGGALILVAPCTSSSVLGGA